MRNLSTWLFLFCTLSQGIEEPLPSAPLNAVGRKRLNQNLVVLEQNLQTVSENVAITKKNIETLRTELLELEDLEKEYLSIRKRYQDSIFSVEKELEKNNKAINELQKFSRELLASKSRQGSAPIIEEQIRKAEKERLERESWKKETNEKLGRIQVVLNSTVENLKKIQARRTPLMNQVNIQNQKETDYRKAIQDIEAKKSEVQKLLSAQ